MIWLSAILGGLRRPPAPAQPAADPVVVVPAPPPSAPPAGRPVLTPAARVLADAISPALALLPARMDTPAARVIMLAISGQEAAFVHRWQVIDARDPQRRGPARGLWQFERGGGVAGVLRHASSRDLAQRIALQRIGNAGADAVWQALEHDDVLAGVFARLLLWTDPAALPAVGREDAAWALYLRCWRPGAWTRGSQAQRDRLRAKWAGYYDTAVREVMP